MARSRLKIDIGVLVDIISNVAGMMILLACVAIMIKHKEEDGEAQRKTAKPISFPLAYIPEKRSLTVCLKYQRLYRLPEEAALEAISKQASTGKPVRSVDIVEAGVNSMVQITPTWTGYRFHYRMLRDGGTPLSNKAKVVKDLDKLIEDYPPDKFFYVFHAWPDCFSDLAEIREYLHERGVEVGWQPRVDEPSAGDGYDIVYSMGEYDESLTSIKAQ
jgi:hypothetical protein